MDDDSLRANYTTFIPILSQRPKFHFPFGESVVHILQCLHYETVDIYNLFKMM